MTVWRPQPRGNRILSTSSELFLINHILECYTAITCIKVPLLRRPLLLLLLLSFCPINCDGIPEVFFSYDVGVVHEVSWVWERGGGWKWSDNQVTNSRT